MLQFVQTCIMNRDFVSRHSPCQLQFIKFFFYFANATSEFCNDVIICDSAQCFNKVFSFRSLYPHQSYLTPAMQSSINRIHFQQRDILSCPPFVVPSPTEPPFTYHNTVTNRTSSVISIVWEQEAELLFSSQSYKELSPHHKVLLHATTDTSGNPSLL